MEQTVRSIKECEEVSDARVTSIDLGTGLAAAVLDLPRALFYHTCLLYTSPSRMAVYRADLMGWS